MTVCGACVVWLPVKARERRHCREKMEKALASLDVGKWGHRLKQRRNCAGERATKSPLFSLRLCGLAARLKAREGRRCKDRGREASSFGNFRPKTEEETGLKIALPNLGPMSVLA